MELHEVYMRKYVDAKYVATKYIIWLKDMLCASMSFYILNGICEKWKIKRQPVIRAMLKRYNSLVDAVL